MDQYVFRDAAPGLIRCMQCALYYPKGTEHKCPAQIRNVLWTDLEDDFKKRNRK